MPANVRLIIDKLMERGYEAYIVGGCVRDSMLGKEPDDWDITTSAQPCEIKRVFSRTVDTGIAHGTITVLIGGTGTEVTTYRIDGEYEDNRHPTSVEFTTNIAKDLKRRDFTINAMAYNDQKGLVDLYGGMEDLSRQTIRCVGEPRARFGEDALRILRAVRFAAQLGFTIEKETCKAIQELAYTLKNISAERIQTEVVKLLVSARPGMWKDTWEMGITKVIMPEFDEMMVTQQNTPYHMYSVGEHTLKVLENVRADKILRMAALLHDVGKPVMRTTDAKGIDHFKRHSEAGEKIARDILKRLKFDNDTLNIVSRLIRWHDLRPQADEVSVRRAIHKMGDDIFPYFIELQYGDIMGKSEYDRDEKIILNSKIRGTYLKIKEEGQCISLKGLAISGKDLIELGIKPGPDMGKALSEALEEVLVEPEKNNKEYLIEKIKGRT